MADENEDRRAVRFAIGVAGLEFFGQFLEDFQTLTRRDDPHSRYRLGDLPPEFGIGGVDGATVEDEEVEG